MTDSPHELAAIVGKVNASLRGAGPMPPAKSRKKAGREPHIREEVLSIKDPLERMRSIAAELTAAKSEFDIEDIKRMSPLLGNQTPERLATRLLENGLIYEVSPGKFKVVRLQ